MNAIRRLAGGPSAAALGLAALVAACGSPPTPSATSAPVSVQPAPSAIPTAGASTSIGPTASESPSGPAPSTAAVEPAARIPIGGGGPLGLAVQGTIGWVVATDSGELVELDLVEGRAVQRVPIGPGTAGVIVDENGNRYISRYDTGSGRDGLLVLQADDRPPIRIETGPLGGLALGEAGTVWTLDKSGRVAHIGPLMPEILGSVTIDILPNEHLDIVAGAGARWASSDHTAVRRIDADGKVAAEIETGGGIPLAFADGLVWGARADEVWGIDPATNAVAKRVPLDGVDEILDMDVADGTAWIAVRRPGRAGHVLAVDLAGGALLWDARASLPAAVQATDDRVWVADYEADAVLGFAR